jgi:pimeloyl-ACP methyl ester carboxylesterase
MSNPLLLVHGGFQGAWIWDRCLGDLKKKFDVYTPTLKGMGNRSSELNVNVV